MKLLLSVGVAVAGAVSLNAGVPPLRAGVTAGRRAVAPHAAALPFTGALLFDCDGVLVETEELHRTAYNEVWPVPLRFLEGHWPAKTVLVCAATLPRLRPVSSLSELCSSDAPAGASWPNACNCRQTLLQ